MDEAFINELGDLAVRIILSRRAGTASVETKRDGTRVTDVDREVERALREAIVAHDERHGIIGEEFPPDRPDAAWVWIIDPIDGTKEFVLGLPLFGTLVALRHEGRFVQGLAVQPLTGDRWVATDGQGTRHNGVRVGTRSCGGLAEASLSTMGYDTFCAPRHQTLTPLRAEAAGLVTADSFFVFGLLASGRVDGIVSDGFALHDYAALDVIVREAGGTMTDWQGRALHSGSDGSIVAAGDPRLHQALRDRLKAPG